MFTPHEFTPYEKKYMDIIEKLKNTFLRKNADYGSSVKKNYDKFEKYGKNEGLKYVFGRIAEKHDRLENLIYGDHPNQVIDESIEDTLLDMANYAILAAVSLQEHKTVTEHSPIERLARLVVPEANSPIQVKGNTQNYDHIKRTPLVNDSKLEDTYYGG